MANIISYATRVLLVYLFTYFATRVLTKKAIAQMTSYELAGVIILTTVGAEPLVTKVTTKALFGVGLLVVFMFITARLALFNKLTPILEHSPSVVINNGKIDTSELKNINYSLNQLKGLLRQKGYDKVSDVEVAIIEPQGNLSVIPKSQKRPLQPSDINLSTKYEGLTIPLIIDGSIKTENLNHLDLNKEWLIGELSKFGISNYKNIALAELDTSGNLLFSNKKIK